MKRVVEEKPFFLNLASGSFEDSIQIIIDVIKERIVNGCKNVPIYFWPLVKLNNELEREAKSRLKEIIKEKLREEADKIEIFICFLYRK